MYVVVTTVYRACSSTTTVSGSSDGDFKLDGTSSSDSQLLIYVSQTKIHKCVHGDSKEGVHAVYLQTLSTHNNS